MNKEMNFDFIGRRKIFWIISACIIVVGLLCNLIFGVEMDVTFKGGTLFKYNYEGSINIDETEKFFSEQIGASVTIDVASAADGKSSLNVYSTAVINSDKQAVIEKNAAEKYAANKLACEEDFSLSASVGNLFFVKCLVATVIASVFLVIYVAFRFVKIGGLSAGLMAVAALAHDLLMVYFAFVIFRIPLNGNFVAVMLTVLGYSLNDTIVIYDRIRENRRRLGAKADINEVVNMSLNQSFRRTLNTSVTTAIVVVTLVVVALITNLDSVTSFAVPLLFGVISGFYSSTFLCAPTWAMWVSFRQKKAALK